MKAFALYGKEDMRLEEMPLPAVGEGGLIMRILACAVCGSDARMYFNGPTKRYRLPIVLGHEFSGEVVEVGPKVAGLAKGDVVVASPVVPDMTCRACAAGKDNICENAELFGVHLPGGFAEYLYVPDHMVHIGGVVKLPPGSDLKAGALTEVVACCLHGLGEVGGVSPQDEVLIIGDGAVGLTFVQLAKLMGAGRVITTGRRAKRRELSRLVGADEALDATAITSLPDYAREHGLSPTLVIVAAATTQAAQDALKVVRSGGRVLLFSGYVPGTELVIDPNAVHYRELHISGSIDCTIRDFQRAATLAPRLHMGELISHEFPFSRTVDAYLATKEADAVRVMVVAE